MNHAACHHPRVVPRRATDLDAEAHVQEGSRLLARDRADVPDARLDFCLGEQTVVDIGFVERFPSVERARVRVRKPDVVLDPPVDHAAVIVERTRG